MKKPQEIHPTAIGTGESEIVKKGKRKMEDLQFIQGVECYIDKNGVVELNLEHVAKGLGFVDHSKETLYVRWSRVDKYLEEFQFATSGERPKYIPEPIFYLLAMKADNQTARNFQKIVAYDILPAIRKHGLYAKNELLENPDLLIEVATQLKQEQQQRKKLEEKIEQDTPKVLFANAVAASHAPMLIGELAKIIKQNGVNMGEKRLFQWMRDNGYLIRRIGTDYNAPTQKSMDLELFKIKETAITHSDGHVTVNRTTKVTGKGQQYFINRFLGKQEPA